MAANLNSISFSTEALVPYFIVMTLRFKEKILKLECVLMFLRTLVLQNYSLTECISSPTCRVESPTRLF